MATLIKVILNKRFPQILACIIISLFLFTSCIVINPTPSTTTTQTPGEAAKTKSIFPISREICPGKDHSVILLLDPNLIDGIEVGLEQFTSDLCTEGYTVIQRLANFSNPLEVRAYLTQMYQEAKGRLTGVIIIGDLPHAYQWVISKSSNPSIPETREEVISYQYYGDINGIFGASPAYKSPGNHQYSYDQHSGDLNWELWIGILPIYKGDIAKTTVAINSYFTRNHAYRHGLSLLPHGFLEINEHFKSTTPDQDKQFITAMSTGEYAWIPFTTSPNARLYFDSNSSKYSLNQGYNDLQTGVADIAVQDSHGSYSGSGKLSIKSIESNPLKVTCFWSNGCAIGNLDHPDNFLTSVLYSPTSSVLVAKGTTNDSGGMGNNKNGYFGANIAKALLNKKSLGDAILSHVNVPLVYPYSDSREFHFATAIILGDPTLKLR
jgi:hypothetical protein